MDVKEMEKKFSELSASVDVMRKDFELKLGTAQNEVDSWKQNAQKREDEIKQYKEQAEKAKKDADEALGKAKEQEIKTFAEGLKREGKITPAQEEMAVELMKSMISKDTVMTFREKDGSEERHTQFSLFRKLLSGLQKRSIYGEQTRVSQFTKSVPDESSEDESQIVKILSKGGEIELPIQDADLDRMAEQHMEEQRAKNVSVSYADALIHVSKQQKIRA